jgi:hypothetical protein
VTERSICEHRAMRVSSLALPALAAALALSACGSGDRLTKAEYIAAADAICAEAIRALNDLDEPKSLAELAEYAPTASEIVRKQLDRLRDLRPPEADEALIDKALDLSEEQNELAEEVGKAAADGDEERAGALVAQIQPLDEEANQIAQNYGLRVCGADN